MLPGYKGQKVQSTILCKRYRGSCLPNPLTLTLIPVLTNIQFYKTNEKFLNFTEKDNGLSCKINVFLQNLKARK